MTNDTTKGPVEAMLKEWLQIDTDFFPEMLREGQAIDQQIADLRRERDDAEARARHSQEKRVEAEAAAESWAHQAGVAIGERINAERERDAAREVVAWAIRKRDYNHAGLHDGPNDDCMEGWCREINPHLKLLREQPTDTAEGVE